MIRHGIPTRQNSAVHSLVCHQREQRGPASFKETCCLASESLWGNEGSSEPEEMGSNGRGSLFGAKDNESGTEGVLGGRGGRQEKAGGRDEDTDPEIQVKLGSGMQSCEVPVKPSKSQKSSLRKKCQGKKNKGLSPKYVFHGRWKREKRKTNWGRGTSLVVQGLRLQVPNAGSLGSIPGQGTRACMPQLRLSKAKLKGEGEHMETEKTEWAPLALQGLVSGWLSSYSREYHNKANHENFWFPSAYKLRVHHTVVY